MGMIRRSPLLSYHRVPSRRNPTAVRLAPNQSSPTMVVISRLVEEKKEPPTVSHSQSSFSLFVSTRCCATTESICTSNTYTRKFQPFFASYSSSIRMRTNEMGRRSSVVTSWDTNPHTHLYTRQSLTEGEKYPSSLKGTTLVSSPPNRTEQNRDDWLVRWLFHSSHWYSVRL